MFENLKEQASELLNNENVQNVVDKAKDLLNSDKAQEVIDSVKDKASDFIKDKFGK